MCKNTLFLLSSCLLAQNVQRDIPYAEPKNDRQVLDVYSPAAAKNAPVLVYVHGGGWVTGSKNNMDRKPVAFNEGGYVFVAMNYRFVPDVDMGTIIRDVAKSVGWVHRNIAKHGGDPNRLILMGHSAGAQLAAILCVDHRYLQAERVPIRAIRGCIPSDGDTYDVPLQVATATARRKSLKQPPPRMGHPEKFGDLKLQREYSAVNHITRGKTIPPFLILHVADHTDTSAQAHRLWAALDQSGHKAGLFGADNSDHGKLNRDIGAPDDPATAALFSFLGGLQATSSPKL